MTEAGPLNLLSLDGGGVRGLSSLLILQNLMHRIAPQEELRPCEIFDMIGGTSTGGIIAIMLGRLRMKISDCIAAYHALSAEIFDEPWRPKAWKLSKAMLGLTGSTDEARSKRLRAAVCKIIEQYLPAEEKVYWTKRCEQFNAEKVSLNVDRDDYYKSCLTFVVATQKADGKRILLRSFPNPREIDQNFSIVEACLATSAAPLIFAPLLKDRYGMAETFIDGGLGHNNPISLLVQESHEIFANQKIKALISVGTGAKISREVDSNLVSLAKKVAEMATDATIEAEKFSKFISARDKSLYNAYFRFDTSNGLSNIPLQEWRMLAIISQRTRTWLSEALPRTQLEKCAQLLTPDSIKEVNENQMKAQTDLVRPTSHERLPELDAKLVHHDADWPNEIIVKDLSDGSELKIRFWRTVRIPEDGTVYDLPAGLGLFPLLDAAQFQDRLRQDGSTEVDCVIPMYDHEAMYMEFIAGKYDLGPGYLQRPYAIRPYVGITNAISGKSIQEHSSNVSPTSSDIRVEMRVGKPSPHENLGMPPPAEQDYIVAEASASDIRVKPQWLDGIAVSPGRVRQFVTVPFGSGKSVEAQKVGKDNVGGIHLEIIPSFPVSRLRRHLGREITIYTKALYARNVPPIKVDAGALVWDYMYSFSLHDGASISGFYCIFLGKALEPLGRLSHYGIGNHSTIHLVHKLRGGGHMGLLSSAWP